MLIACGGSGKSNASSGIEWKEGGLCAVLFLGYGNFFATILQTNDFKEFCKRFPALQKATAFTAETEGDEVYYIIPRHSDATVTVHEYKFDIEAMKESIGKELYRGGSEPILIRCNLSDMHPNTSVTVTGNGKSVTFNPMSGLGEREGVQFVLLD